MKVNYIIEQIIFNCENNKGFETTINVSDIMEYNEDEKIEIKFDIEKNSLIVKTEKSNSIKNLL